MFLLLFILGEDDNTIRGNGPPTKKRKFLSNEQRHAVYVALRAKSVNGKISRTATETVASVLGVSKRVIQRIWKQAKDTSNNGGTLDVSHRRIKNCGRKKVTIDMQQFSRIPLAKRTTLRSMSYATKISKTTLQRRKEDGTLKRHSNPIKPVLKEENKRERLQFCVSMLEKESIPHDPQFINMNNIIHIDEKWFYLTKKKENYYILANEKEPYRTCKSKNFVGKVMFLTAVARPRFDAQGNVKFDGKIGTFPFITKEPAKRSSINQPAGTLETKAMTSVGRDVSRLFLIEKVIPAIKEKWPKEDIGMDIFIQQDNAPSHVDPSDPEFCQVAAQVAQEAGFNIHLMCQPPNSPDLNVLDLGLFNGIQSLRDKKSPKNVDELVNAVEKAFADFSPKLSNYIFLTLQYVMVEIMKGDGTNDYKIPHNKKSILEREGRLHVQVKCEVELVKNVIQKLQS